MNGRIRRRALVQGCAALLAALTITSTSGCAAAARALVVVDTLSTVQDVVDTPGDRSASDAGTAVVDGTGGSGLWLREEPGGRGLTILPEGSTVTWSCLRDGPSADGPRGTTTAWARVTSEDGESGFSSAAFLRGHAGVGDLPRCP